MNFLDRILMSFIPHFVITGIDGTPYLVRYYLLRLSFFRVKLHHILRSDEDRELHDHPWNFISLILWRGYWESRSMPGHLGVPDWPRRIRPWSIVRHRATDAYRLVLDRPAWTLVFSTGDKRMWGFHMEDGWVSHRDFLDTKFGAGNYTTQ